MQRPGRGPSVTRLRWLTPISPPAERQPAARWLKAAAAAAAAGMTLFDAYFFPQACLNILQVTVNNAW